MMPQNLCVKIIKMYQIHKMSFLPVITGMVITAVTRAGSLHATISIINVYKEGNLAIQQAGKNMSAKILVVCKQCPLIRRGKYTVITALCVYKR